MGDRKGLLPLLLLTAALGFACLPKPEEPVEWLEREDAIIVQMRLEGGYTISPGGYALTVPDLTLYGDGTLIYTGRGSDGRLAVFQSKLSDDTISDTLQQIADTGFLDFPYRVPSPSATTDMGTTYIYVNTKFAANAVSAYDLRTDTEAGDDEFEPYRRLAEIARRLAELEPQEGTEPVQLYEPEALLLVVMAQQRAPAGAASPGHWRIDGIDLAEVASGESGVGERVVNGKTAAALMGELRALRLRSFQEDGRVFSVGLRPILPYEENFPEFEAAQ